MQRERWRGDGLVPRPLTALPQVLVDGRRGTRPAGRDDQLDGMHRARADLDLLGRAMLDQILPLDPGDEPRGEFQDAVEAQDVGDEVVGEHRQPGQIAQLRDAGPVQVRGGDLGALEEWDPELVVAIAVGEARPAPERRGQADRRPSGRIDDAGERSAVLVAHAGAEVAQRRRVELHQFMARILPEDGGEARPIEPGEFVGAPRAGGLDVVTQAGGDRVVARQVAALAQRGKPARPEVDGVQRQPDRRHASRGRRRWRGGGSLAARPAHPRISRLSA